jgi:hypothetical protein
MKYIPRKDFEGAEPVIDFRHYFAENHPLHVRFAKAALDSKYIFRGVLGSGLAIAGAAIADINWGSHSLTNILTCEVSYINVKQNQLIEVMHNTSHKSMVTALEGCGEVLQSIDGETRTFVSYSFNSGTVIPGLNLIEGVPESIGLRGQVTVGEEEGQNLAGAIAQNRQDQRYVVQNYIEIAGHGYSLENLQYRFHQAQYAVSDKVKYTLDDIGYWFDDRHRELSDRLSRLWTHNPN